MLRRLIRGLVGEYRPPPVQTITPTALRPAAPQLRAGRPFTVLCWNLQFAGTRELHFFYDGGPSVRVSRWRVRRTARGIADVIAQVAPDIALLQEVDRDSDRTGRIDQLEAYLDAGAWAAFASAPYFRSPYVPTPPGAHVGQVDMHQVVLSRFPIESAERIALPLLDEPRLRQAFNLKRAILTAELSVDGASLSVANTHLSAFSRGDGTLGRQIQALERWMSARDRWILGGDFNLLPPGDDPARLPDGGSYADAQNPIERLIPRFAEAAGDPLDPAARTYLRFGVSEPDRKIDYLFAGPEVEILEHRVLQDVRLSDHLPVVVTLRVRA